MCSESAKKRSVLSIKLACSGAHALIIVLCMCSEKTCTLRKCRSRHATTLPSIQNRAPPAKAKNSTCLRSIFLFRRKLQVKFASNEMCFRKVQGRGSPAKVPLWRKSYFSVRFSTVKKLFFWGDRALSMLQKAFVAHFVVRFSKLRKIVRNLIDCVVKLHKIGSSWRSSKVDFWG